MRVYETPLVSFDETIKQPVAILLPGTPTSDEIDRTQKPHDIDNSRSAGGVIEVVEPPCILRQRKLLDVRIAVQTDNWQPFQIPAEVVAHSCDPGAVDESEIIVRVGTEPFNQLGCGAFERFQVRPERCRAIRCSHQRDGDHCEQTSEPARQHAPPRRPKRLAIAAAILASRGIMKDWLS